MRSEDVCILQLKSAPGAFYLRSSHLTHMLPLSFSPTSSMGGVGGCGPADVSGTIHYQLNSMITTFFDNKNNDRITSDKIHFDNWISTFQSHLCTF